MGWAPWSGETGDHAVSLSVLAVLFSACSDTKGFSPRRAIDFTRVISVLPFIGRKWNNNRGGTENHRVTLSAGRRRKRKQKKKYNQKNKWSLLTSFVLSNPQVLFYLFRLQSAATPSSVKAMACFADTVCPHMRKPCRNRSVSVSAASRKQMQCLTPQVSTHSKGSTSSSRTTKCSQCIGNTALERVCTTPTWRCHHSDLSWQVYECNEVYGCLWMLMRLSQSVIC